MIIKARLIIAMIRPKLELHANNAMCMMVVVLMNIFIQLYMLYITSFHTVSVVTAYVSLPVICTTSKLVF